MINSKSSISATILFAGIVLITEPSFLFTTRGNYDVQKLPDKRNSSRVSENSIIIGNFNDRDIYFCPAYTICKYKNRVLLTTIVFQSVKKYL